MYNTNCITKFWVKSDWIKWLQFSTVSSRIWSISLLLLLICCILKTVPYLREWEIFLRQSAQYSSGPLEKSQYSLYVQYMSAANQNTSHDLLF